MAVPRCSIPIAVTLLLAPALDSQLLRAHTYFLAHDLLEGRDTGSRGAAVAAAYLAAAAEALGLRGAAEDGSFFQEVPLVEAVIDTDATRLTYQDSSTTITASSPADFIPNAGTAATLRDFAGELVWIGSAADVLAHPDRLPPFAGRVAVMAGTFGADLAAADTLASRGAVAVIQLVGDDGVYALYVRSRGPHRTYVADPSVRSSFAPALPAIIARAGLVRRFMPADLGEDALARPLVLAGHRVAVTVRTRERAVRGRNVVALLAGADPALRAAPVVFTAHYDHLGLGPADARGDSIYNGFSDNAAGCAMLLAIARAFVQRPPPRSVLFLFLTGEERGLLGSDYFVAHLPMSPDSIRGVINLDAGAPPAAPVRWNVAGGDRSELGELALQVAARAGWEAQVRPASPNTDYFPFLRLGIPAVFLVPAPGAYEGLTTDSSNALRRRWDHYHEPADAWAADFPFAGLLRYADFARRLGLALMEGPRPRAVR